MAIAVLVLARQVYFALPPLDSFQRKIGRF
jgi:hypothetical protein